MQNKSIVLGGGCFWCLEAAYQLLEGVTDVVPGYAGGHTDNPSYEDVVTGSTGHVEVVNVTYDPFVVTLDTILAIFWSMHDPTSLNQQGADVGTQYASAIFYFDEEQKEMIETSKAQAQSLLEDPIVSRIEPLVHFYEAEQYHHNYFRNNPGAGYCSAVIEPKLSKLRKHFSSLLSE